MKTKLIRTERGWAGHFICATRCQFRRNTLLEYGDIRVVVSSVGMFMPDHNKHEFNTIGFNRHFETMAFHARREDDRYWDADVQKQISFDSDWAIAELDADDRANDMHEAVCKEISAKLKKGETFECE